VTLDHFVKVRILAGQFSTKPIAAVGATPASPGPW